MSLALAIALPVIFVLMLYGIARAAHAAVKADRASRRRRKAP